MLRGIVNKYKTYSAEINAGFAVASFAWSVILAAQNSSKAEEKLKKKEEEKGEELTLKEKVMTAGPSYSGSAVAFVSGCGFLYAMHKSHVGRTAGAIASGKAISSMFADYRSVVKDVVGEKKAEEIDEEAVLAKARRNETVYLHSSNGNVLCYDYQSGRYFMSDPNTVYEAINKINARLIDEGVVSLNDYYELLNLPYTADGDNIGWIYVDKTSIIKPSYAYKMMPNSDSCFVIAFLEQPPKPLYV